MHFNQYGFFFVFWWANKRLESKASDTRLDLCKWDKKQCSWVKMLMPVVCTQLHLHTIISSWQGCKITLTDMYMSMIPSAASRAACCRRHLGEYNCPCSGTVYSKNGVTHLQTQTHTHTPAYDTPAKTHHEMHSLTYHPGSKAGAKLLCSVQL